MATRDGREREQRGPSALARNVPTDLPALWHLDQTKLEDEGGDKLTSSWEQNHSCSYEWFCKPLEYYSHLKI